MQYTVS